MYFEKITVKGEGKTDSIIELKQGVNIIQGRSNTGKTAVIRCIDYALGASKLPIDESFRYNEIEVVISTPKGEITINRVFQKNQVTVSTTIPDAENGLYDLKRSKNNKHPVLSDLLLSSMGINIPCEIIQNKDFKKRQLTIRTFLGMLMFIHTDIGSETSIIEQEEKTAKTPFLSALLLLLNGENLSEAKTQTKLEIRVARKKTVEDYINKRISTTTKKRNDLEEQMKLFEGVDIEKAMRQALDDVNNIETQIQELVEERRKLVEQLQELQNKDSESKMLLFRYLEIDGHKKTNYQGLGYCAFINTVTSLVFRRYFSEKAKFDPGFLIVDTPLIGLDQGVEDAAPESMRTGLFRYIMKQKDVGQIIILENLIHIPDLDYESDYVYKGIFRRKVRFFK